MKRTESPFVEVLTGYVSNAHESLEQALSELAERAPVKRRDLRVRLARAYDILDQAWAELAAECVENLRRRP